MASKNGPSLRRTLTIDVTASHGAPAGARAELLVLPCCEDESALPGDAKPLSKTLAPLLADRRNRGEFTGKANQLSLADANGLVAAKRLLFVGLGKRSAVTPERIRQAMGKAAGLIKGLGVAEAAMPLFGLGLGKTAGSPAQAAQAQAEGLLLGLYEFTVYKTEAKPAVKPLTRATILAQDRRLITVINQALQRAVITSEATQLARDLGNHPSNFATPSRLAELAQELAGELKLRCTIMERAEMERLGMGALVGVARGSQEPPKLIILEYKGGRAAEAPIALVGKTITFDTGGISLKPSENMEQMKDDMSGGAAVLCAIQAAARLKLPLNLVALLPATENMPSGTAQKPGDVVTTLSGLTVEVINTDAEGRLVLADALNYATRFKPRMIVDIATLTGACTVALGKHAIGLMGTAPKLVAALKEAGEATGERVWELPLWEPYYEQIKSQVADLQNVGGRPGGTITAGAFLSKFVGDYPWAHLDIASTAWTDEAKPYAPKGVTGVGVRLLIVFLSRQRSAPPASRAGKRPRRKAR
ncbi:MAG: leucyl aminopeptidase [Nitrospirota bacterium]